MKKSLKKKWSLGKNPKKRETSNAFDKFKGRRRNGREVKFLD